MFRDAQSHTVEELPSIDRLCLLHTQDVGSFVYYIYQAKILNADGCDRNKGDLTTGKQFKEHFIIVMIFPFPVFVFALVLRTLSLEGLMTPFITDHRNDEHCLPQVIVAASSPPSSQPLTPASPLPLSQSLASLLSSYWFLHEIVTVLDDCVAFRLGCRNRSEFVR
uniref:Uncharacterized protein n=1 Tax=Craspedostauros australis TaxID=1486917 RepID=A0A7S0F4W1_9STRA|mmetsp:Transcript_5953/g.16165  ORF Transcript_5953/g.16165 Transcript_5953/m.16165 type:complete len:166 (+) Transcript_5953:429-926(+)